MDNAFIEAKVWKLKEPGCARVSLGLKGSDSDITWLTFELLTMITAERNLNMDLMLRAFEIENERRKDNPSYKVVAMNKSELWRQLEGGS